MFRFRKKDKRAIRIIIATDSFVMLATAMIGPIYALFVEEIGGDLLDASYAGAAFALAAGITTLVSGKFADRVKEKELIVVAGYSLTGMAYLLLVFVNSIFSLLAVQLLIGFAQAFYTPAFDALFSQHANRKKFGTQWAVWESMFHFTAAAGALIGGIIVTLYGFDTVFVLMALLCSLSALYIYRLPRKML